MPRDHRAVLRDATPVSTEGQRTCAREAWCTGYRLVPQGDGTSRREPGLSYQAFCAADTALIAANLSAETGLPAAWLRLEADLGDPARRGEMIRVPFGPRMLLSEYYDLLMRRIAEVLCSHEERVRAAARLVATPARHFGHHAVERAASTLETHLSVLLALSEAPVWRHIPSAELRAAGDPRTAGAPILEVWQDATVYANRDGTARIAAMLSGAHAGLEILDLHRRCLTALGEVATHPELLEGVPCRVGDCGTMGLERAEPPADPTIEAPYSRCPACGDTMKLPTYRDWARWYAAWASSAGPLTCQRCLLGRCESCIYTGCACAAEGHQDAALRVSMPECLTFPAPPVTLCAQKVPARRRYRRRAFALPGGDPCSQRAATGCLTQRQPPGSSASSPARSASGANAGTSRSRAWMRTTAPSTRRQRSARPSARSARTLCAPPA